MPHSLTKREERFLDLLYPDGTICVGLTVGWLLSFKGYVKANAAGRYALTRNGIIAVLAMRKQRSASEPVRR